MLNLLVTELIYNRDLFAFIKTYKTVLVSPTYPSFLVTVTPMCIRVTQQQL